MLRVEVIRMTGNIRTAIRERPQAGFELPDTVATIECDLADGMRLSEYRRARPDRRRRSPLRVLARH
jgi:hypothetical protein